MIKQILIILIILLIILGVYLSRESIKLDSSVSNNDYCQNYSNSRYNCPYNQNSCQKIKQSGYSDLLCVFNIKFLDNFNLIEFIKKLFAKEYSEEDIFNESYYIKKDTRQIKLSYCKKDISECELNSNFIKIKNDGIIRISQEKDAKFYYIYTPYYFFTTFLKELYTNELEIKTYTDLLQQIEQLEIQDCSNFTETQINSTEYQTKCIFNRVNNLDAINSVLENTMFKAIPEQILYDLYVYLKEIKIKQTEITMLEYLLYVNLDNKYNNTNYKIKFSEK